jgi:very-short-patch-repair endonuclease
MPDLEIICNLSPKLNFACHQNSFSLLHSLNILNNSSNHFSDLTVCIESNPSFLMKKEWHLNNISPKENLFIKDRDIQIDGNFLLNLTESIKGSVRISLKKDEELIVDKFLDIELLAVNEWGGTEFMPELLASFVIPNESFIDKILKEATEILRKFGKSGEIDGYDSKSRQRVWEITSAIYTAICNFRISYSLPPASFERNGQKIRLPGQIYENRLATCLDSTLLFAAVFEQAGLNPVIVIPQGHAMVGVWLQPEELSAIIVDEAEILRKRIQLQELILIETTCITSYPPLSFSQSLKQANAHIEIDKDETFCVAVDVKQARSHQIKPIGLKSNLNLTDTSLGLPSYTFEQTFEESPSLPDFDIALEELIPDTPAGRLERWQRRLLDLTLTNRLLNHKNSKGNLELLCPDPAILEDKLASGSRISIQPLPISKQDADIHQQRNGTLINSEYARESILKRDTVLVNLPEPQLSKITVDIYRKTQVDLQEGGANTLYLAFGFLLWKRSEKDERKFRAPLILVPVTLERKSAKSGVTLLAHDDESRFNTTLLEMLRRDFEIDIQGLDTELPKDQSGIDVQSIWNKVRIAIKDVPGFEVTEDVVLSHYSFAKYLMWKDLVDRTEQLKNNPVVAHLIDNPREVYQSKVNFVEASDLDKHFKPADIFIPLPADSSQIAVIATADRGKDFVIFGPPGTGKSQTIANLISHLLAKGKTILFVSEKIAALEVVHKRLHNIGLGSFCLELHSNKARKMDILNQFKVSWDGAGNKTEAEWGKQAEDLEFLRDKLNLLLERLHKPYPNGLTPYKAIGIKVRDEGLIYKAKLSWSSPILHSEQDLKKLKRTVEKLSEHAYTIGNIANNPLKLINFHDWRPKWEDDLLASTKDLQEANSRLDKNFKQLIKILNIDLPDATLERLESFSKLLVLLAKSYKEQAAFGLEPDGLEKINALEEAIVRLREYSHIQESLSCKYKPESWRFLDGKELTECWYQAEQTWWPKKVFLKNKIKKRMIKNGALGQPDVIKDAELLVELREKGEYIDTLDVTLSSLKVWKKHITNPCDAEKIGQLGKEIREVTAQLSSDVNSITTIRASVRQTINEVNDLLAPEASIGSKIREFLDSLETFKTSINSFNQIAGADHQILTQAENILETIPLLTSNILSHKKDLKDWCNWVRVRSEAIDLDLKPLIEGMEDGSINCDQVSQVFEYSYCDWWSRAVFNEDDVLRCFSSAEHTSLINKFKELDEKFQNTTAKYIHAKLSSGIPTQNNLGKTSSWGILQREIQKQRQHKSVRQLIKEIPDVVKVLAPCLMMSPLSIAQYLPTNQDLFDVVIFDEASQITVWDAVGAISRGKQLIVAGDPKQMPPANRFNRADSDDSDIQQEADLASILDEMIGASIPSRKLNWHYRSRRESLIAFSNHRYYDSSLITFPAPTVKDTGVKLVKVKGIYARGAGRHNEIEAKAVVAECIKRLTHSDESIRRQSIGIITFNSEQQSLIEDLLDNERSKNPAIEWAFNDELTTEKIFAKNIETVQGDERDVIFFSITFGPDQSGHITMNFGDLNKQGGEKRLNVALTRARSEMIIFSSLTAESIDLSRTKATAVTDLKHFLEFAQRGATSLGQFISAPREDYESPFEMFVARALKDLGWEIHNQIGVSAYRIDLGVVHPDKPGVYLAGIECDGATYHSSATAKDRDKVRQKVLEGLGWKFIRIWSTDWWTNKQKAISTTHQELLRLLEIERKFNPVNIENDTELEEQNFSPLDNELVEQEILPSEAEKIYQEKHKYVCANLSNQGLLANPDLFYEDSYKEHLNSMIQEIVKVEGPIHEDILVQRIAQHHSFSRVGNQIYTKISEIARNSVLGIVNDEAGTFFYLKIEFEEFIYPARYIGRAQDLRKLEYIHSKEICAISEALGSANPIEIARALGIGRLSKNGYERIEKILKDITADVESSGST